MNPQDIMDKLYNDVREDLRLVSIGCTVGRDEKDPYKWKATMIGPNDTAYKDGLFQLGITFPKDFPSHGPEFQFLEPIYHLNVDKKTGHICLNTLNEWKTTGRIEGKPGYGVNDALIDIFYLFYQQGTKSPYDEKMSEEYEKTPELFEKNVREWVKKYNKNNMVDM